MKLRLVAIGAVSMLGQVVLLRELGVAFFGSELIYVLALGAWLLGSAAGAASGRRAHVPGESAVRWLLVLAGLLVPLSVVLARGVRILFGAVPGAYLPFDRQMLALAACVLPVSLVLGLLFQWAAKRFVVAGRTLAGAYAIESAGGIAGGLAATLLLAAGVQNLPSVMLCAAAAFGTAARPERRVARGSDPAFPRPARAPALAAFAGLALVTGALAASARFDRALTTWNHPALVATRDTPYGRVTVSEREGQMAVFEDDALAYESQGVTAEQFVHLAAIQRAAPREVLVLGGAAQGLIEPLLRHGPGRVTDVELNLALVALVVPRQPADVRDALADPRVRLVFGDPRRFLARPARYDLVLSGMPEPESGRTNRCYTREFFTACAARLAPDGVLALKLRGAENLWTPQLARRAASIHRALRAAFADVVVLPGTNDMFLASNAPLSRDPELLGDRLRRRGINARLVTPAYVRYLYGNDRFAEAARVTADTPAPVNRDARPLCYQATMTLWLARFFPRLARLDLPEPSVAGAVRSPWSWAGVILAVGLIFLARRRPGLRRCLLAGAAGFAGMTLEAALLLQYQTRSGVLYQDLGVLLMAFMAGLAAGAGAFTRLAAKGDERRVWTLGIAALAALAALGLAAALLLRFGLPAGLVTVALFLAAAGFFVAAAFAYATLAGRPEQRLIVGPLYAADLAGGCLASLVAGLATIPMLGIPSTAALAGAAALAALLMA